jgi:type II secretory pathway pseudopilin PulG
MNGSSLRPLQRFLRSVNGFTFLAVMFSIVLIGLSLTGAVQQWKTIMKREREAELLFRGDQIRKAIAAYQQTPGISNYPQKLEHLVKVPNISATKRFLRKVYKDPITSDEWAYVKIGDRIKGVYSKSEEEPLKQANFPEEYKFFEGKTKYSEWVFEFTPQQQVQPPQQPSQPSASPPAQRGR